MRLITFAFLVSAISASAQAQTTGGALLADNFAADAKLNSSLWSVNTPLVTSFGRNILGGQELALVNPSLSFSATGMTVSGITGEEQMAGIQSNAAFTPPFVLQATAQGLEANGNPFGFYLFNAGVSNYLRVQANLNPNNTGFYGFIAGDQSGTTGELAPAPSDGIWYTMTIVVEADGATTVTLADPSGAEIGQESGLNLGTDPLYVVVSQDEFLPVTVGSNQAVWQEIEIFSGTGGGTSISAGGIVNSANYGATVAPGSIAAVFGSFLTPAASKTIDVLPLPINLFDVSMQVNGGTMVPLFFMSTYQANVQIPWEAAGQTTFTPAFNAQPGTPQTVTVAPFAPGIFTQNASGGGPGAILDASYQLVTASNPVTAGTGFIQIYCTGLGAVTNQPRDGAVAPESPLAETTAAPVVTIGGVTVPVYYSGLAPGFVGLYQVNAGLPANIPAGEAVPVVVTIGGVASNTVTIAVQ
jgi:uncharacterized protein (TIGR03437 family)